MLNEIINAYKNFWIQAGDFQSSSPRADWWYVQVVNLIISLLTIPIFFKVFGFNIYGLICIVPQIALDTRRIRDFGKDWKWIFINFIPLFGWFIWFLWMGFGQTGRGQKNFL